MQTGMIRSPFLLALPFVAMLMNGAPVLVQCKGSVDPDVGASATLHAYLTALADQDYVAAYLLLTVDLQKSVPFGAFSMHRNARFLNHGPPRKVVMVADNFVPASDTDEREYWYLIVHEDGYIQEMRTVFKSMENRKIWGMHSIKGGQDQTGITGDAWGASSQAVAIAEEFRDSVKSE